jgi:hypothetical protein
VVVLFWFHDEYYLALFNIPYLLFNMWKYSSRKNTRIIFATTYFQY